MSKKKHKSKSNSREEDGKASFNNLANNPFGIDPNQLMSMLGNVDQNKLNNIMASMEKEGIDLSSFPPINEFNNSNNGNSNINNNFNYSGNNINNNMNNGGNNSNMNPMDLFNSGNWGNNMGGMGSMNPIAIINQLARMNNGNCNKNNTNNNSNSKKKNNYNTGDPNMDMLLALRNSVAAERIEFVDKIIGIYKKGDLD